MKTRRLVMLVVLASISGVGTACREATDTRPIAAFAALPAPGQNVPEFSFPTLNGGTVSSGSLRGRPAVIVLWSTWCSGSRAIFSQVQEMAKDYRDHDVALVVLADDSAADIRRFIGEQEVLTEFGLAEQQLVPLFDRSGIAPERTRYRVEWALPLWLILDAEGRIIDRDGGPAAPRVRTVIDSILVHSESGHL